ncbi:CHASE2 domain-containing protein [Plectonema cf. radiosum LEGE 06105]|uniref:CHASE2 domain-containing protein n=1 Tax=Plectonema cf. radiosum LEGE 06105 TaxID=945769 RepID=A0A8J7K0X8_9CYAN|nr:CHASE2 domain-containing protein [Plectonema radiosum]MBE9213007.1 CHASE2 domain-containing protein [Plectonema cf. radiosum LEGE 06105]
MTNKTIFKLKVRQITSTCNFELSWGDGLVIDVNVNYPFSLTQSYENWHRAYLDYYVRLRGKKGISGTGSAPRDFHKQLVETEAQLLREFQQWLLSPELVSINRTITKSVSQTSEKQPVEIFLTCTPIEIAKLPWESWDIYFDTDSDIAEKIRIARTPANISYEAIHPIRHKIRVLAILGDDSGLDLKDDKEAIKALNSIVDVQFVGWNKKTDTTNFDANALKHQIIKAISDKRGWDILFFAGHSNETQLTGGELGIAPGVALSMQEIEGSLKIARKRGLQFAIFNSCNGINIAEFLINLGLSQVAVMREPIHDQVAQIFLVKFLQSLAQYKDVHTALLDAIQLLQEDEKRVSYPSAYLVPSLFRHAEAKLFQIQPFNITSRIKRWFPTKLEAKWLAGLLLLSLLPYAQSLLLEPRILVQAIYREKTPFKPLSTKPRVLFIKIDKESFEKDKIQQRYPLDYSYLARIIKALSDRNAKLIGIDYILDQVDKQPANTSQLKAAILEATAKKTTFVFGYDDLEEDSRKGKVSDKIINRQQSKYIDGSIYLTQWYLELPPSGKECLDKSNCPFSYLLALNYQLQNINPTIIEQQQLNIDSINKLGNFHEEIAFYENLRSNNIYNSPKQLRISSFFEWFHPIIDFSIHPDNAYKSISACNLLGTCKSQENSSEIPDNLDKTLVIIAPGGYSQAGLTGKGEDNATRPLAVAYWRGWEDGEFPTGEAHAYMVHHLLNKHLVVPVPDFLVILLAALLAKGVSLYLIDNPQNRKLVIKVVSANTIIYFLTSLQLYISGYILLPVFLPATIFWKYIHFTLRRLSK